MIHENNNAWDRSYVIIKEIVPNDLDVKHSIHLDKIYENYIEIYKILPIDSRLSRKSERLRFRFSREFFDDQSYQDTNLIRTLQEKAKKIIINFDFDNATHGRDDDPPVHLYEIDTFGKLSKIDN